MQAMNDTFGAVLVSLLVDPNAEIAARLGDCAEVTSFGEADARVQQARQAIEEENLIERLEPDGPAALGLVETELGAWLTGLGWAMKGAERAASVEFEVQAEWCELAVE